MFKRQKLLVLTIIFVFTLLFIFNQPVHASNIFIFNKNLQTGNVNVDVKELQRFLNNNGFILSKASFGSLGQETTYFGSATRNALIKFQKTNKIAPAVGYFGPVTRRVVNRMVELSTSSSNLPDNQTSDNQLVSQISNQSDQSIKNNHYTIGGSITGISGPVILKNNNDVIAIKSGDVANFTFSTKLSAGSNYYITATTNYSNQKCYLKNNVGTINNANIDNIRVTCGLGLSYNPFTTILGGGGVSSYTLTYTTGTGGTISGTASQTVNSGSSGSAVTAMPDTGYSFSSWSDSSVDNPRTDNNVSSNLSVTANFTINTYTVTFDGNTNTGGTTATQTLTYNTVTALTSNGFTKTGYTFAGWATTTDGEVAYADEASYTIGAGNVTLYAKWDLSLSVGDNYQGGKIGYIFQEGDTGYVEGETHGLIVATANQSTGIIWAKVAYQSTAVPGGTGVALGAGSANTDNIIAQNGLDSTYAAGIARAYRGGDYEDWYLPSLNELYKLFLNRVTIGGFTETYYWSSSENSATTATSQSFSMNCVSQQLKSTQWTYVRAVRSF